LHLRQLCAWLPIAGDALSTIDLDCQPPLPTDEVDTAVADRKLPVKFAAAQPPTAHFDDSRRLGTRLVFAENALAS
jgi:hypothetical protein